MIRTIARGLAAIVLGLVVVLTVAVIALRMANPLPSQDGRALSRAIAPAEDTALGARTAKAGARHRGKSGVLPLSDGRDALLGRIDMVDAAERSIDAQYYMWHDDISGMSLLRGLRDAAARGVRVRLLLDDNGITGMDGLLAALHAQPNFEVRIFNPSTIRAPKLLGYGIDFFRMNRRMHNKALIVDGAAAILGGRNIGDEYFEIGQDVHFSDMDVLVAGPVVRDTATAFDAYWNSASVYRIDRILGEKTGADDFDARLAETLGRQDRRGIAGALASRRTALIDRLATMEWTDVTLVVDDPAKGLGDARRDQLLVSQLGDILGETTDRLDLISAYFVPGTSGLEFFSALAGNGRTVRVLTNAMTTTDVLFVHAGYSRYRRALLAAGIDLYELKPNGPDGERGRQIRPLGISGASLHAKTFAIDGLRVFIGSFNFDPRSALLNCEMGVIIESPALAQRVDAAFDGPIPTLAYRPALTPDGDMVWIEKTAGGEPIAWPKEPGSSLWQQVLLAVVQVLPVEWLL